MSEGTIVTFYSYKGGVGRTFALANIGALLSLWGYKTLCVDWDLEAPGLHLYFKSWLNKSNRHGLTELIQSHVEGEKPDWQKYVSKVNIPYAKASLYLMSAGLQDNTYIQRMQALNWTELYESHTLGNFLEELRGNWKETLDFVLIDSRTGISDIGSICTVQLPDLLVVLLTANDQSLYGSLDVLQSIEQIHANLPLDRAKLWIMPVVSRFEGRVEYTLAQEWLAIFAKALAPLYAEWAHKDVTASDLLNFTRIPYVPYWSFGEKLPVIERGTEDPEDIGFLLETLASLVARKFSHSDGLIKNRNSFVALAKQGPIEASVLISFTPSDEPFAVRLKRDIEARGFTTRSTCHEQQFDPASQEDTLGQMIRTSQLIVLIVSPHTWPANLVKAYRRNANKYERQLVIVWAAGDDRATLLPDDWGTIPGVDLIDARQTQYEIALDEIITRIERGESLISPSGREPRNPYKGLRTFTAQDARDFFGRERLIEELIDRLRHILTLERPGMATARMLSVIGASSSGKSSVVLAGLLPHLQAGALPGSEAWVYLNPIVPGRHPLESLALALASHLPDRSLRSLHEDLQGDSARGLHLLAATLIKQRETKVVLFVDQFEELFTQTDSEDELRHFLDLLVTATTEPRGPAIVVLTLRADFYDRPMGYSQLYQLIQAHQTSVLPMGISELREVIEQPAALPDVRLTFEGNLVGELLSEVQGQVGALPLLQFTLDQLFQRRDGHRLTLSAYYELGGVKGALTKHAEATYNALPSNQHRHLARALFLRLFYPGATEQDTTRRRAALSEFTLVDPTQTRLMQETINTFIAMRLLTTNEIAGTTTIEVSHNALIREWPRLAGWLREARNDILLQQAISEDAEEWSQRGKPRDRLYRGSQLEEAQEWALRNIPSGNEKAFVQAGSAQGRTTRLLYIVFGTLIVIVFLLLLLLLLFLSGNVPKFV